MIDFKKDILLFDIETTGLDETRHEIIQLAAVLLDRRSLAIKKKLNVFIKPTNWKIRDPESMAVNKIQLKTLRTKGVSLKKALEKFSALSKEPVILSQYGGNIDISFLKAGYKKLKTRYPFDYHAFDIWGLCFYYCARNKRLGNPEKYSGFSLEDLMAEFGIKNSARHDALADCIIEAQVLRRVLQELR